LQAELERHSQEEARKKIACLATQHAEEIERLKEERHQMQEQHKNLVSRV